MFKVTAEEIAEAGLTTYDVALRWSDALNDAMVKYDITTPQRQAGFLANCAHESQGFRRVSENLNYSVDGLRRVFPRYFDESLAQHYARKPEAIANHVYAHRLGNGDERSGDGWKYRGRGLIQLTGRSNYRAYSPKAEANPDLLLEPFYAADSAGWFWHKNDLNTLADRGDVTALCRRINGGLNGLVEREKHYDAMLTVLNADRSFA